MEYMRSTFVGGSWRVVDVVYGMGMGMGWGMVRREEGREEGGKKGTGGKRYERGVHEH